MYKLLIFAITMLFLSSICNGQGYANFGSLRIQDTSRTFGHVKFTAYGGSLDTMLMIILPNGDVKKVSKNQFAKIPGYGLTQVGNTFNVDTAIFFKNGGNDVGLATMTIGTTNPAGGGLEIITQNDSRIFIGDNEIETFNIDDFTINDNSVFNADVVNIDSTVTIADYPNIDILGTDANGELVDNSAILDTFTSRVFPLYDATRAYIIGNVVQGSDSNVYRAITSTTGNNPVTNSGAHWELYAANTKLTLNVPSRFATIAAAKLFSDAAILNDTLIIQIADGTYNIGTTTFNMAHPFGYMRKIRGNVATPANVIIRSAAASNVTFGVFHSVTGGDIGIFEGFTVKGPGNSLTDFGGFFLQNNATAYLKKIVVDSCYFAYYMANGATIKADTITGRYGGDGNAFVYGGHFDGRGCTFSNAYNFFARAGAVVEYGGSFVCFGCTLSNNAGDGVYISNNGVVNLAGGTISGNVNGIRNDGGSVDQTSVTFSGNTTNRRGTGAAQFYSGSVQYTIMGSKMSIGNPVIVPDYQIDAVVSGGDAVINAGRINNGRGVFRAQGFTGNDPSFEFYSTGAFVGSMYYQHANTSMNLYFNGADRLTFGTSTNAIRMIPNSTVTTTWQSDGTLVHQATTAAGGGLILANSVIAAGSQFVQFRVKNTSGGDISGYLFKNNQNTASGTTNGSRDFVLMNDGGGGNVIIGNSTATSGGGEIRFFTQDIERMRITENNIQLKRKISQYNSAAPTNGQLLIGHTANGTFEAATLTAGTGISITNGAGAVTVATSGDAAITTSSAGTLNLTASGHYIFTGTTSTWTLPAVSGTSGRVYFLKNRGSGTVTINTTAAANELYSSSAVNTYALLAGSAIILVSDGTFYNVE